MVASSSSSGATRAAAKNSMTPSTVPGAADREGEGGAQARGVGGPGARQRARMLGGVGDPRRAARLPHLAGQALARREHHRAAGLGEGGDARWSRSPTCARSAGPSRRRRRRPQGAEVPRQRLADGGEQARVSVVLVGRRGQHARDGVLRAQEHGDVGSLVARGHGRRQRVRRASHMRWARRTHRHVVDGRLSVPAGSRRRRRAGVRRRVSRSTLPARPLPMTVTKRAPVSRTWASARSSQETVEASAEVTRSRSATTVTTRPGLQRHLQRGVERLARGQVELAPQLDHRGHAHPVHGASEQRADRSWDLVTVDAHG